jgi:diguanylate cyclase (GGDEF)-like protein
LIRRREPEVAAITVSDDRIRRPFGLPTRSALALAAALSALPSLALAAALGARAFGLTAAISVCGVVTGLLAGRRVDDALDVLARAADVDALTGLRTRRWAEPRLRRALARVAFGGPRPVVALLDLDRFKQINDVRGHLSGDRALRAVARCLEASLRPGDWAARWGGDEFLIVIVDARIDHALGALERIRATIGSARVDGLPPLSVSIGVALSRPGDDVEHVLARSDRALYRVKRDGGDAVRITAPS